MGDCVESLAEVRQHPRLSNIGEEELIASK